MNKEKQNSETFSKCFVILAVLYAAFLIISNVLCGKILAIGNSFYVPAGVIAYTLCFCLSDCISNLYGIKKSILCVKLNFVCCALFAFFAWILIEIPHPVWWQNQAAYQTVFGSTIRIIAASLSCYFISDLINSYVLCAIKKFQWSKGHSGNKGLSVRALGSSAISLLIDSFGFVFFAFYGVIPTEVLCTMALMQWSAKIAIEAICMPILYKINSWVRLMDSSADVTDTRVWVNPILNK